MIFFTLQNFGHKIANCTRIQNTANTHFNPHLVLYKLQVSLTFNTKHNFSAAISLPLLALHSYFN